VRREEHERRSGPREVVALGRRAPRRGDPIEHDRCGEKASEQDSRDPRSVRSPELPQARGELFTHRNTSLGGSRPDGRSNSDSHHAIRLKRELLGVLAHDEELDSGPSPLAGELGRLLGLF
jgi:hypothetical protein